MKMSRSFYHGITNTRFWSKTTITVYYAKKTPKLRLYILNIFVDGCAILATSNVNFGGFMIGDDQKEIPPGQEEIEQNKVKEQITAQLAAKGFHEIGGEEFMQYVDELFPRWRELKFNKKTKQMYYPEEEQDQQITKWR